MALQRTMTGYTRIQQTFSVKGQIVNILGFTVYIWPLAYSFFK